MKKIAVLVSGGGTNLQAIIDASESGRLAAEVVVVISNKVDAYALERARQHNIPAFCIKNDAMLEHKLAEYDLDLIVLAGYLKLLSTSLVQAYPDKIINIHPSLIPSFCGKGFYGIKVHEAALRRGVKVTGATVHFVNENYDQGRIIAQAPVPVYDGDTAEILQKRVLVVEHKILVEAIDKVLAEQTEQTEQSRQMPALGQSEAAEKSRNTENLQQAEELRQLEAGK